MTPSIVLIIGDAGPHARRLKLRLGRKGLRARVLRDCGHALESLQALHPDTSASPVAAIVLDVETAGLGALTFRQMLADDYPRLPVLALPPGDAGSEDVGLLVAAIEDEVRRLGADEEDEDRFDAPLHGYKFEDLNSRNARMHELFGLIARVAQSDSPVLILGETGTGKELVAAAIHRQSDRRAKDFFTINCGALTETLLESELFGHERGAFTGAVKTKKGYFELASGGTLFLDELGTIAQATQVKLLRVLETMEVRRVGGGRTHKVDVRIVAATNASIEDAVRAGTFRSDLYYRLNVVPLSIPPLRDRPEDVPLLAEVFRQKFCESMRRSDVTGFSPGASRRLKSYAWPGNVRELQNVIERAVLLTKGPKIEERDLLDRVRGEPGRRTAVPSFDIERPLAAVLDQLRGSVEREYLRRLLRRYDGHMGRVADHAGMNRRTLYNKLRTCGLDRKDFTTK